LSGRRGQYAERYGALSPWRGKWDMKLIQDYNFKIAAGKTNTIQFSVDVLNLSNLLNSKWGLFKYQLAYSLLEFRLIQTLIFQLTHLMVLKQKTFNYDASLLSRWQAQFGIRYIF
jgi:hypothetical protein